MGTDTSLTKYQGGIKADSKRTKPLIEQASNNWKKENSATPNSTCGNQIIREQAFDTSSCVDVAWSLCISRQLRTMILYALLALLAFCYLWSGYLRPRLFEDWAYQGEYLSQDHGTYGIAKGGDLDRDLVRIKQLDPHLLPGGPVDPKGKRRLVFVGDVHGCKNELLKLLNKVRFSEERDHLILTGDVISKGPDNVGVLEELIRLKATSVRGNHEDRILHTAKSLDKDQPHAKVTSSKGFAKDVMLLKKLNKEQLDYLRDMPLMLHISALPQALKPSSKLHSTISEDILVVHAGLVPGVRLDRQDPYFVMNMRSINRRTHVPSVLRDGKDTKPWFDVWNWYSSRVSSWSFSPFTSPAVQGESGGWLDILAKAVPVRSKGQKMKSVQVIYGHDSKAGLKIKRWSKGLDSGCVSGGELTAMTLDAKGQFEIFCVGCGNYRA